MLAKFPSDTEATSLLAVSLVWKWLAMLLHIDSTFICQPDPRSVLPSRVNGLVPTF